MAVQQQKATSASGKCKSIFAGRISTIWLGSVLLISGAMSQAGAAVAIRYFAGLSEVGAGIWCGYMFQAAGAVAIAAGHHGTRNLIIGTIVTSALAVVTSIAQLAIAGTGIQSDMYNYDMCYDWCANYPYPQYCPCYSDDWEKTAIAANGAIIGAAVFAFIAGLWILVVACIAIRRNPASFQGQQVMQMPTSYIPLQTNPNQQVFQVPVQLILNTSQSNVPEEMRNQQQIHSMPVQYVLQQQQYQQPIPLIQMQPNTIAPSTFPSQEAQGQDNQAFARADGHDTALEF